MKQLLIFLFALVATTGTIDAQRFINPEAIRLRNGSEATAKDANGTIYYDLGTNKFRFRENGAWINIGGGGSSLADGDKGNISVSGGGSIWTIDNGVVTLPKLQNVGTNIFLGRTSSGSGVVEELTPAQAMELLPQFNSTTKGVVPLSGGGTTNFLRADGTWAQPPGTGGTGSGTTETASNGLTKVGSDIRLGGALTTNTTISAPSGHNFKITNGLAGFGIGSADFFWGGFHLGFNNYTSRSGAFTDIWSDASGAQLESQLADGQDVKLLISANGSTFQDNRTNKRGLEYASSTGYVTQPTSLTTKKYVDDAIAAVSSGGISPGDKGDITVSTVTNWVIDANVVSYAKMQDVSGLRFLGRSSSTVGDPQEITMATATGMLNNFSSTAKGVVPASGGGTTNFLRADGTWAAPPTGSGGGSGTVTTDAGQVAYGTATDQVGGEGAFTYNATTNTLTVGSVIADNIPVLIGGFYNASGTTVSGTLSNFVVPTLYYTRVDDIVHVNGYFTVRMTGTEGIMNITLPISSDFTSESHAGGIANIRPVALGASEISNAHVQADPTNNRAQFWFYRNASTTSDMRVDFSFMYQVF